MAIPGEPDAPMLWLRFIGADLHGRSVPISELGESLQAVQLIVTQAHLHSTSDLRLTSLRKPKERRKIALQLAERRHDSDAYGMVPFLSGVAVGVMTNLLAEAMKALLVYASRKVLDTLDADRAPVERPDAGPTPSAAYVAVIYKPVMVLVRRINPYSGVEQIEISSTSKDLPPVVIDADTKSYVVNVARKVVLGPRDVVSGRVKGLLYDRNMAIVEQAHGRSIRVRMSSEQFDSLRQAPRGLLLQFHGQPRLTLGARSSRIDEFEASMWARAMGSVI